MRKEVKKSMKTTSKRQDNINVRIGHSTKSDLTALAQANELSIAEYVRHLIRNAIEENKEMIQEQKEKGLYQDRSADSKPTRK